MTNQRQEPKYCDRSICVMNEYNGIGCDECEVTKSQESKTDVLDKIRAEVKDIPSCMLSTSSEFERGVNAMLGQSLMIIDKYRESVDN